MARCGVAEGLGLDVDYFVFGSNLAGQHTDKTAEFAERFKGAKMGIGKGFSGQSYAMPVQNERFAWLPLNDITINVREFLLEADRRPKDCFTVMRMGCGRGGYSDRDMSELFRHAPPNVQLPAVWLRLLGRLKQDRVILSGQIGMPTRTNVFGSLSDGLARLYPGGLAENEIVVLTGFDDLVDKYAEEYSTERRFKYRRIEAREKEYGRSAQGQRARMMTWAATSAVLLVDDHYSYIARLIRSIRDAGLPCEAMMVSGGGWRPIR